MAAVEEERPEEIIREFIPECPTKTFPVVSICEIEIELRPASDVVWRSGAEFVL